MAARLLGLTIRTLQRWAKSGMTDKRKGSRATPANKMSDAERQQIIKILESPEFAGLNPNQIVPRLADQGIFLGSESTKYRILRMLLKMNAHREASRRVRKPALFHYQQMALINYGLGILATYRPKYEVNFITFIC
ncbi:MAG: helix-turn-helix domain-containing protein [Desulfobacter sp.]|nr:helix-turn-helix domain-containing protein [Desulfobacter sp.]